MTTSYEIGDVVDIRCWNCDYEGAAEVTEIQDGTAFAECPECGALDEP